VGGQLLAGLRPRPLACRADGRPKASSPGSCELRHDEMISKWTLPAGRVLRRRAMGDIMKQGLKALQGPEAR